MRVRYPLYLKILFWFFLNLALLGIAFYLFFSVQLNLRLGSLLSGRTGESLKAVSEVIASELRESERGSWNETLDRFSEAYGVTFVVFRENGRQLAGTTVTLPPEIAEILEAKGNPPLQPGPIPPRRRLGGRPGGIEPPVLAEAQIAETETGEAQPEVEEIEAPVRPADPLFLIRAGSPQKYWAGIRAEVRPRNLRPPHSGIVLVISDSLLQGGLFFNYQPWLLAGLGVFAFCLLFWFPLVRGMTRAIRKITLATEQVAEGNFDAQVDTRRGDELGRLGRAIDRMATRLEGFVTGQKRFIGDIAHELCSPLARIQMSIGTLERDAPPEQRERIKDLQEEVDQMSEMVNELLSFSRATMQPTETQLEPIVLKDLINDVIKREVMEDVPIEAHVDESFSVLADSKLLSRSLANLIRNAIRYAGDEGPIEISAATDNGEAVVTVSDSGPGVPEDALPTIFDPFYRPESSRSRESGGVGLGLAIVKSCIEACKGTVSCRNREPRGFEVELRLAPA